MTTIEDFVDVDFLKKAYHRCQSGKISVPDGMSVWVAVTLGLWLNNGAPNRNMG